MEHLVAPGSVTGRFPLTLSGALRVSVSVGDEHLDLNPRGAMLVSKLLEADPSLLREFEALLDRGSAPEWMSPEEAAAVLGVSRPTVVRWAKAGKLTDQPVGTHHRYPRAEVEHLRAERAASAAANREAAQRARAQAAEMLDVPPTPAEMIEAGRALREGRTAAAEAIFARAHRADARRSAGSARTSTAE